MARNNGRNAPHNHLTSATLRAHDMRAALDPRGSRVPAEIGRRKGPNGALEIIRRGEPFVTVRDSLERPTGALRQRFTPSLELVGALPRPVGDAWSRYLQASHPRSNPAAAQAAEDAFADQLAGEARRVHELRRAGCRLADLSPQDQAVYFFASAQAAVHKILEVRYATPTILGVINVTDYGTDAEAWSDTLEGRRASLPNNSAWSAGGPGAVSARERTQLTGLFRAARFPWSIDQASVNRHAETVNREGGPTWDLLDAAVLDATASVDAEAARIVAFGSKPGSVPAVTDIPGLLYLKSAGAIDITSASGETNYATLRDWMIAQQTAALYSAGLAADVLVLCPSDYMRLAGQKLNSAGSDQTVIEALLALPFLREIRSAREFEPLTAEATALEALGMSAVNAAKYSGGIRVGGVQKKAVAFLRDDPAVITVKRGREPYVTDGGLSAGTFTGEVASNNGGTYLTFAEGLALAYQS